MFLNRGKNCTCKHYNGTHGNKTCDAGVVYSEVTPRPREPGCAFRRPCRLYDPEDPDDAHPVRCIAADLREHGDGQGTCPLFELPTDAEFQVSEAELQEAVRDSVQKIQAASAVIGDFRHRHKRRNGAEEVDCPTGCGGKLRMSIAAYNGHVACRCTTAMCINFME